MVEWLNRNPPIFNSLVHVDKTAIGGCRKYIRGRIDVAETRWLFGVVDGRNQKCYLEFMDDHNHDTIIPIIQRSVMAGVRIHGAQVYHYLRRLGYNHFYVVHNNHYVNPITGIHSNHIENLFSTLTYVV